MFRLNFKQGRIQHYDVVEFNCHQTLLLYEKITKLYTYNLENTKLKHS